MSPDFEPKEDIVTLKIDESEGTSFYVFADQAAMEAWMRADLADRLSCYGENEEKWLSLFDEDIVEFMNRWGEYANEFYEYSYDVVWALRPTAVERLKEAVDEGERGDGDQGGADS